MNLRAISHQSRFSDCYPKNEKELTINIRTGKDITGVNLLFDDPYDYGISGDIHWVGRPVPMVKTRELKYNYIYSITVTPEYRRLQYCFELFSDSESVFLYEDGFYSYEEAVKFTKSDFDKNPELLKAVEASMSKW